jgi:D-serine deaminase-like pyridoxal phosphate-dependent protein
MAQTANWFEVQNIDQLDTPVLLFYPERIKENIKIAKSFINDVSRLRPHVKTHKCVEVSKLMLDAGITKFKCATVAEAEMLGIAGAPDVLLAYQPTAPKIHRLIALIQKYPNTKFSCLIDNAGTAALIADEAEKAGLMINVFVDVNIGMNRTGILPAHVLELYQACSNLKGITIKGLHAYDGHIYAADLQERAKECYFAFKPLVDILPDIKSAGFGTPVIVAGGTPTYPIFAKMPAVECSPGTFALWDEQYSVLFDDLPFLYAALVATRVVSVLDEHTICVDLGHKAIAAENMLSKRVVFLNAPDVEFVGHSEEHMVIRTPEPHQFKIGDVLYGLPVHICPTCNLYDRATVVESGEAKGEEWKIVARDRIITV